jgi:serine protease AprX
MSANLLNSSRRFSRSLILWLALFATGLAFADDSKISPDLQPLLANPASSVNVIVQYNSAPQTCTTGILGNLVCTTVNLLGGAVRVVFTLINAVAGTTSAQNVITLSNQPDVSYISLDRSLNATLDYSTAAVNAQYAWTSGLNGSGVGIAVIDSGIYSHPDLTGSTLNRSRVVYRQSFIGGVQNDDYGHGTHVAGIAAGNGSASSMAGSFHTYRGVAPNANLLDLRVLDGNGSSNDSTVIAAIEKAVQLKNQYNVRVINLSLGRPIRESCTKDPLCQAVEAAWNKGIVVVVAAGNLGRNGYATILSPANSPRAITVGAMKTMASYPKSDDLIASYSSKGPTYIDLTVKPDVVAPGNLVASLLAPGSTLQARYPENVVAPSEYTNSPNAAGGGYFRLSGTSMATPVVSGTVALMLQRDPALNPDTVKARLMKTASKTFPLMSVAVDSSTGAVYPSTYDIFTIGAGYVDISAALNNWDRVYSPALSPSVHYNPQLAAAVLVRPSGSAWNNGLWSLINVWGNQVVVSGAGATSASWGDATAWASSASWGDSSQWGTSASWGDTTASGTSASWGDSVNGHGEK